MNRRYRYRLYPTPDQQQMLARTFGCARRVYNDSLQVWYDAWRCSVRISDSDVQRRVITEAKTVSAREWLGEVSSVALIQSFRDARSARSNMFNSAAGRRKGRRVQAPRYKTRKGRQAVRFTRNGFRLRPEGTLYLAKVGNVEVRWSRELPSPPSSVTVTKEADGRYYASFVVEIQSAPLPVTTKDVGVDLGLTTLAVTSDGERIANPRRLKARSATLAKAQRALARKRGGSKNRAKAAARVAAQHRKVRDSRADYLHKTAMRLIRDNQAIYVEDLAVAGLARTRLAKSVYDAGWAALVRHLEAKAEKYGRVVVKVGRWFPSSQLCSACGHGDGKKPLDVRQWSCAACGVHHDRDVNAAKNILLEGRRITAAGLAVEVCGADVSPGIRLAVGVEAESRGV